MCNTYLQLSFHRVYSPQFIPLSTDFIPCPRILLHYPPIFFSYPQILFPYPHILLPYPPILFSYSQVRPPSYLRLDPCLECLDEIAKVSASWLILNSKRNTQNISSSASLCLSRLLVYMCRVREKYTD